MFCLRGWGNQVPALITIEGLDEVAKLRRQIAADLDALKPRLEELDKSLDNATRNARSYQLAKIHRQFSLRFTRIPPPFRPATPKKVNSAHYGNRLRQEAVPNTGAPLPQLVCDMRRVICVGRPMTAEMRELRDRASELISLECGEGSPGLGVCSRSHPKIDSILGWYGLASEQERSHVDVILLSRSCTRFEVELLRSRLYPHQRLIVEPGSGAFTWLLAEWDGFIERSNGLFLLTEPGSRFREPSRLGCVSLREFSVNVALDDPIVRLGPAYLEKPRRSRHIALCFGRYRSVSAATRALQNEKLTIRLKQLDGDVSKETYPSNRRNQ